jgi:amino acid transporter
MIAVAGTIGTGLFLGSGASLVVRCDPSQRVYSLTPAQNGGPVGFFLGYAIVGSFVGMMMYCLGEM